MKALSAWRLLQPSQLLELRHVFDALGHYAQTQRTGQTHYGSDDLAVIAPIVHASDEAAVYLQLVQGQLAQVGKRREAGAEVVQRHLHAQLPQRMQALAWAMAGAATKAVTMAITAEKACASGPKAPRWAAIDSSDAAPIAPTPTGSTSTATRHACVQALNQQARNSYDRVAAMFGGTRTAMLVAMLVLRARPAATFTIAAASSDGIAILLIAFLYVFSDILLPFVAGMVLDFLGGAK